MRSGYRCPECFEDNTESIGTPSDLVKIGTWYYKCKDCNCIFSVGIIEHGRESND